MAKKHKSKNNPPESGEMPLSFFACPNPDCADFNRFNASNPSVAERMGKDKAIRRLYCKTCQSRFSEREGSLLRHTKLPVSEVVRIIKCLGHGCTVLCEVARQRWLWALPRSSGRLFNMFAILYMSAIYSVNSGPSSATVSWNRP